MQHEYAVVSPGEPGSPLLLGSEDATTCHILIIRDPSTRVTGLAHIDVFDAPSINQIRDEIIQLSNQRLKIQKGN